MRFAKLRLAAVISLLSLGGCAEDDESLIIAGSPLRDMNCGVTTPANVFAPGGILDVRFETAYSLPLEVQNQLPMRAANSSNTNTDTSEIQLIGVDVTLFSDQRPDLIDRLSEENPSFVDFSPPIPTDSIAGNGSKPILFEAIPSATSTRLSAFRVAEATAAGEEAETSFAAANPGATEGELAAARLQGELGVLSRRETIIASITVRGRTAGNTAGSVGELESRSYHFPIEICHGCLISCASCELPIDDNADGMTDRTLVGVCPNAIVPDAPTERASIANFVAVDAITCGTAQDRFYIPGGDVCTGN